MGDAPKQVGLRTPVEHSLCEEFRLWLLEQGFEDAVEICPVDGGEYMFATEAHDLIGEFLDETRKSPAPDERDALKKYALELGQISDIAEDDG